MDKISDLKCQQVLVNGALLCVNGPSSRADNDLEDKNQKMLNVMKMFQVGNNILTRFHANVQKKSILKKKAQRLTLMKSKLLKSSCSSFSQVF